MHLISITTLEACIYSMVSLFCLIVLIFLLHGVSSSLCSLLHACWQTNQKVNNRETQFHPRILCHSSAIYFNCQMIAELHLLITAQLESQMLTWCSTRKGAKGWRRKRKIDQLKEIEIEKIGEYNKMKGITLTNINTKIYFILLLFRLPREIRQD